MDLSRPVAVFLGRTAAFSDLNERFLGLQQTIGLMLLAILFTALLMLNVLPLIGAAVLGAALSAGCATQRALTPFPANGPDKVTQPVADILIRAVNDTRATRREVAGWCWSDVRTGQLTRVVRAGFGDRTNVGLALPIGRRGNYELSCSWHTHLWGPRVVPGPSRQDLRNSRLPQLSDIHHFVIDRHGIWHYADGRVLSMCPWNAAGTNFDAGQCRR